MYKLLTPVFISLIIYCAPKKESNRELVKRFLDAREKNDSALFMKLVSSDMRVWYETKSGEGSKWNPGNAWTKWDAHFKPVKTYGEFQEDSNAVTVISTETNNFFKLIDRKPANVLLTWWINKHKKIDGYLVKSMADSSHTDRLAEFVSWAHLHHPAELEYLMPNGSIKPDGDRPQRWENILKAWRAVKDLK